jgi:hypothetical protein
MVVALAERLTEGERSGVTVMIVYALSATGLAQGKFELILTQIVSWSLMVLVVNTGEFVPTGIPFFLHE